jgi:hypothetical protein
MVGPVVIIQGRGILATRIRSLATLHPDIVTQAEVTNSLLASYHSSGLTICGRCAGGR